ncbi:MAG: hypothetical protein ACI865_003038 [Flavobacteriaceae bacterium]|jgi:hypothetical protein
MHPILLYPIIPAIILGILNWVYWKKRGYTSIVQLFLGMVLAYVVIYYIMKRVW